MMMMMTTVSTTVCYKRKDVQVFPGGRFFLMQSRSDQMVLFGTFRPVC